MNVSRLRQHYCIMFLWWKAFIFKETQPDPQKPAGFKKIVYIINCKCDLCTDAKGN